MLDDLVIRKATEEVLAELNEDARRFEIEPALGPASGENARQIRVFEADGTDRAAVVDFQNKDGGVSIYFEEMKDKIRRQLETLFQSSV
jgi:hypothetical protein